jgi:CubicO group peptidase (beta-lactamase class C family)
MNGGFVKRCSRRQFLGVCGLSIPALGLGLAADGKKVSVEAAFDREVEAFMQARNIPGGALAVVKDRRLVYARGYGWADREKKLATKPDSLFRIASISKPFTAVAVLKLAEERRLDLDARAFELVNLPAFLPEGKKPDERLKKITIRHLLHHTGGWDRDTSFDPMFRCREIAKTLAGTCPPGPREIIRYMRGQPLDFDPGTRFAYSNFGYCLLGRVIEKVTGAAYQEYVQEQALAPIGAKRMRLGASRIEHRVDREVAYYTPNNGTIQNVFDDTQAPWPYGGFCLEAMDAHGGWLASAVDLARFAVALDRAESSPLLKPETLQLMYRRPPPPVSIGKDGKPASAYYGCGWNVRPIGNKGKANYWHSGSLPGTYTLLVRRWDGLSWAVLFNQRSDDKQLPDTAIDSALHRAADAVAEWPARDLFG